MFKIELKKRDFRKSLYFYIVDSGKKKKKKKKNGLRLGAGIILNQELKYSRRWGEWAAGACQRPDNDLRKSRFSSFILNMLKSSVG